MNAGDGPHEHPTQGLLDMMTIRQRKGRLAGLTVALVGDIAHSRTARSNIWGLKKLGAQVIVCGPSTLVSPRWAELGVEYSYSLDEILPRVDVLNLLRIQFERQTTRPFPSVREYAHLYAMNRAAAGRRQARRADYGPRPDQPRGGDHARRGRRPPIGDPRTGRQRRGRADGRAVADSGEIAVSAGSRGILDGGPGDGNRPATDRRERAIQAPLVSVPPAVAVPAHTLGSRRHELRCRDDAEAAEDRRRRQWQSRRRGER